MVEFVDGATDTAAVARIVNEVWRWWTVTPESIGHNRAVLPTFRDWLAVVGSEPVGVGACAEFPELKESEAAWAALAVLESVRRRGVGTALYELVSDHARSLGKTELEVTVYEDDSGGVAYAEQRGFTCVSRNRGLRLVLADCPPPSVHPPEGVTITTLAEEPELGQGVWEVACEAMPDIPTDADTPPHPGAFEEFQALVLSGPRYIPEATFVALHGGEAVGYGQLTWESASAGIGFHNMLPVRAINASYPYEPIPDALILRGPLAPSPLQRAAR